MLPLAWWWGIAKNGNILTGGGYQVEEKSTLIKNENCCGEFFKSSHALLEQSYFSSHTDSLRQGELRNSTIY
jgi:hypothetical protein